MKFYSRLENNKNKFSKFFSAIFEIKTSKKKLLQKKIFQIFFIINLFCFLISHFSKKKSFSNMPFFTMNNLKSVLSLSLTSHHAQKMKLIVKNFFSCNFFKNMVGTFCATCTATGYPCYYISLSDPFANFYNHDHISPIL